jgi:transposase InsO family protein
VLTDNGIQFADLPKNRKGPTARFRGHPFDRICLQHGIEHRLTKPNHPWTNGQVERMNQTIKEATVQATTTTTAVNSRRTSTTSSQPTTSPGDSRPSKAQRSQGLDGGMLKKYEREPGRFSDFMARRSRYFPSAIRLEDLTEFRVGWNDSFPHLRPKVQSV